MRFFAGMATIASWAQCSSSRIPCALFLFTACRSNVAVLDTTGDEILTLVTCHPSYFVGPAPTGLWFVAARVTGFVT
jgi:hypothetical protein